MKRNSSSHTHKICWCREVDAYNLAILPLYFNLFESVANGSYMLWRSQSISQQEHYSHYSILHAPYDIFSRFRTVLYKFMSLLRTKCNKCSKKELNGEFAESGLSFVRNFCNHPYWHAPTLIKMYCKIFLRRTAGNVYNVLESEELKGSSKKHITSGKALSLRVSAQKVECEENCQHWILSV